MDHDFDCFGRLVFDDRVMQATLSAELYQKSPPLQTRWRPR